MRFAVVCVADETTMAVPVCLLTVAVAVPIEGLLVGVVTARPCREGHSKGAFSSDDGAGGALSSSISSRKMISSRRLVLARKSCQSWWRDGTGGASSS